MELYFKDNFFSAGRTTIYNEQQEELGELDLRSAFGSALDVYDQHGFKVYSGKFPVFSGKWNVFDGNGEKIGRLRARLSFMKKRFEYEAYHRGIYEITSTAFSREYSISDSGGTEVAHFSRVSNWFAAEAYCLENHSDVLGNYELIAVIMGMHAIQKRRRNAAANSGGAV